MWVSGPAYGIAVTTLPLFDLIYASPEATLTTPFSSIGICLEGCSSVTFPSILGPSLTTRLLYLSETISLEEISRTALITEVLKKDGIQTEVISRLEGRLKGLSYNSIITSKGLVRSPAYKEMLHQVNQKEMKAVAESIKSDDHRDALILFKARREAKSLKKHAKL